MTTIRPGDLWIADIPYTDGSGSKKRPVLVLWLEANDTVVAAVTSAAARSAEAGLDDAHPTAVLTTPRPAMS